MNANTLIEYNLKIYLNNATRNIQKVWSLSIILDLVLTW